MAETETAERLKVYYDADDDTLYLAFGDDAREAVAEEIGDEVFVRYDAEFLHFSSRMERTFGQSVKFRETARPERIIAPIR